MSSLATSLALFHKKKILMLLLALILITNPSSSYAAYTGNVSAIAESIKPENIKLSKHLATVVNPIPIKRVAPKYPISAARNKREGWARLSFVIEEDGSVSNVLVTDTSGSKDFAEASKKAILKWKYKPAFENGKPIQQCANTVQMDFKMSNAGNRSGAVGVTRRFMAKYKETEEALANHNFELVEELLNDFSKFKTLHMTEYQYLQMISAEYAQIKGDKEKQLHHLIRINSGRGIFEDNNQNLWLMNQRFMLQVELKKYYDAYKTYRQLSALEVAKPYMGNYTDTIEQINALIDSDKPIAIEGKLEDKEFWQYHLLRNEFSLDNIEGQLTKLDVRCANKRHVFSVEENNVWKLPNAWKDCSVFIYGEDNSKFTLVEHPINQVVDTAI